MSTLVIQSHTDPVPYEWLTRCIESVRKWSDANQFDYRWIGDELFDEVDPKIIEKVGEQKVIATDLARLYALKQGLETYDRVIWLDADFLVFEPEKFLLPSPENLPMKYMVGREVWVQQDQEHVGKLKCYVKVHNAFLMFDRDNSFLDFYIEHARRLLLDCEGSIPPQFIGPKLLTAIHNVVGCPVLETAAMLSPEVIDGLLSEDDKSSALELFLKRSKVRPAGTNLCASLVGQRENSNRKMMRLIDLLISVDNPLN